MHHSLKNLYLQETDEYRLRQEQRCMDEWKKKEMLGGENANK